MFEGVGWYTERRRGGYEKDTFFYVVDMFDVK